MIERSRHDGIHELRLARPPVNALDPTLCGLLREAVDRAVADGARGIVLSGAPGVFSAGLDVPFLLQLDRTDQVRAAWDAFIEATRQLVRASTLADRGRPSMAGSSPNMSPGPRSWKLTTLAVSE